MRRSRAFVVLAAGALGVGAAMPSLAAAPHHGPIRVSGTTPFAVDCNGPAQKVSAYADGEIEPSVAVNPQEPGNAIIAYQEDRYSDGGANGVLTAVTTNAGRTWRVLPLTDQPAFSRCAGGNTSNGGDFDRSSDVWVTFGPTGVAYQAAVSFNESSAATSELVSRSTDGGRTWSPPTKLIHDDDPNVEEERPAITADPTNPNNVYVVWDRDVFAPSASQGGPAMFSRTVDGGRSWSTPREVFTPAQGLQTSGNQIVVLPNGDLVDMFHEFAVGGQSTHPRVDQVMAIRSTDHGATWSVPIQIASPQLTGTTDPRTGEAIRNGDIFSAVAVDPRPGTDTVYAAWEDAGLYSEQRHQIAFSRSDDGGRTWTQPMRVSSNPTTQAFVPAIAVNDHGTVAVSYYDLSADTAASRELATQYWITTSDNGGRTWSPRQQLTTGPFDLRTAPFAGGFFLGEYQSLAAAGDSFMVAETFANDHSPTNRTDIYETTYRPHPQTTDGGLTIP